MFLLRKRLYSSASKLKTERQMWDRDAEWYSQFEAFTFQGTSTCLAMTKAHTAKSILEVGCGTGHHSQLIAKSILARGSRLISCDFSTEMVK